MADIQKLTFLEAHEFLQAHPDAVLLDVREEAEYITGHAVGAKLLTLDEIDEKTAADAIPSLSTPLLVYCRTGRRSSTAAEKLAALGYEKIYDMGGLSGWPYGLENDEN